MTASGSGVSSLGVLVFVGGAVAAARVAGMVAGTDGSSAENGAMSGGGEGLASAGVISWTGGGVGSLLTGAALVEVEVFAAMAGPSWRSMRVAVVEMAADFWMAVEWGSGAGWLGRPFAGVWARGIDSEDGWRDGLAVSSRKCEERRAGAVGGASDFSVGSPWVRRKAMAAHAVPPKAAAISDFFRVESGMR